MRFFRPAFRGKRSFARGVMLIELVAAAAICLIPVSAVLVLLIGGQRGWRAGYELANRQIEIDGQTASAIFGRIGRKSDYDNCDIYQVTRLNRELICGQMVEFRYWGNNNRSRAGNRTSPTEYARIYFDDNEKKLKVDYGSSPDGARRRAGRSVIIAENVTAVEFSRSRFNKIGHGSVKMKLTMTDPDDGKIITIMAAALMRN
jgi:hypothetical protein